MKNLRNAVLLLTLSLSACAYTPTLPSLPDIPSWFRNKPIVEVNEIGRSTDCRTVGVNPRLQVFNQISAVRAWESNREMRLSESLDQLPPKIGSYALIELGQQHTSGFGIAVSRQAALDREALLLKATFITPKEGQQTTQTSTSPCVLVALPDRKFSEVRVLDQNGEVRLTTAVVQ